MLLHFTGLVAIRYGSQTVDPVTGVLAPVVGARLDVSRKNVLPVTASYWLTVAEQTDSVQVRVGVETGFSQSMPIENEWGFCKPDLTQFLMLSLSIRWRHCRERCACEIFTGSIRGRGRKISSLIWTQLFPSVSLDSQSLTPLRSARGVCCFGCKYVIEPELWVW